MLPTRANPWCQHCKVSKMLIGFRKFPHVFTGFLCFIVLICSRIVSCIHIRSHMCSYVCACFPVCSWVLICIVCDHMFLFFFFDPWHVSQGLEAIRSVPWRSACRLRRLPRRFARWSGAWLRPTNFAHLCLYFKPAGIRDGHLCQTNRRKLWLFAADALCWLL